MHEISIMQSTLAAAVETAQAASATQILSLRLRVGSMTGVVPEALQFAFEALREGTIAAEAQLEIESIPASCWCAECQSEFVAGNWFQSCPRCGQASADLRHGMELELASLEVN